MDTRGYGRSAAPRPGERWTTGALMLAGLCGICVGVYAGLDRTAPRLLATPMLVLGVAVAVLGLVGAGRRVRAQPLPARPVAGPELVVMAAGVAAGGRRCGGSRGTSC